MSSPLKYRKKPVKRQIHDHYTFVLPLFSYIKIFFSSAGSWVERAKSFHWDMIWYPLNVALSTCSCTQMQFIVNYYIDLSSIFSYRHERWRKSQHVLPLFKSHRPANKLHACKSLPHHALTVVVSSLYFFLTWYSPFLIKKNMLSNWSKMHPYVQ